MRIAFTSCFSAQIFKQQPVWDEIASANPDVLVLLGDSIYLDVGGPFNSSGIQGLTDTELADHAHKRFSELLAHTKFRALVQKPGLKTYAIWDDHDFLWNDACGGDVMRSPVLEPLVYPSRAMFAAFRETLDKQLAPGSFPAAPPAWSKATPAPGHSMKALGNNVFLHLTDGRSFRKRDHALFVTTQFTALMGMAQLDEMEAKMKAAPAGAVHLVASGSVFEARHGESWLKCPAEYDRLLTMAKTHNILVLSGDVHDNNLASYELSPTRSMHEATSSGAALRTGVFIGSLLRNYGMLTIDNANVGIELFKSGASQYRGTVNRATWK